MDRPNQVSHVFVDFENVTDIRPEILASPNLSVSLLVGARQSRLKVELVEQLLAHAASVQLIRLTSSGKNALDFALAYYLGRAVATHPQGSFHIVSRDRGFDPMIEHLRSRNVKVQRHEDFGSIPIPRPASPAPGAPRRNRRGLSEDATRLLDHLQRHPSSRPRRKRTLVSHSVSHLGQKHRPEEVERVVDELTSAGHLSINEKELITYHLD